MEYKVKPIFREITLIFLIWGIINLLFNRIGAILIIFAIIIYASQKPWAVYASAAIWFIISLYNLFVGFWFLDSFYIADGGSGPSLIFASIINMLFLGIVIYRTFAIEETSSTKDDAIFVCEECSNGYELPENSDPNDYACECGANLVPDKKSDWSTHLKTISNFNLLKNRSKFTSALIGIFATILIAILIEMSNGWETGFSDVGFIPYIIGGFIAAFVFLKNKDGWETIIFAAKTEIISAFLIDIFALIYFFISPTYYPGLYDYPMGMGLLGRIGIMFYLIRIIIVGGILGGIGGFIASLIQGRHIINT